MTALTSYSVPFDEVGDTIVCVGTEPKTSQVVLKHTCKALQLDFSAQLKRLKRQPWAIVATTAMVAEDGKVRELATIPRRTFGLWLASIDTARIKDKGLRGKIAIYQAKAAAVLDHFHEPLMEASGMMPIPGGDRPPAPGTLSALRMLLDSLESQTREIEGVKADVAGVRTELAVFRGDVESEVGTLRTELARIAARPVYLDKPPVAERRRAVLVMLRDPEWSKLSDREIARSAGASHTNVGRIKKELTGDVKKPLGVALVETVQEARTIALGALKDATEAKETARSAEEKADSALAAVTDATDFVTLAGYCKERRISKTERELGTIGIFLRKYCDGAGIEIKKIRSESWGMKNLYRIGVLDDYFAGRLTPRLETSPASEGQAAR